MPSVKPTGPPPMMSTCVSIWSAMEVLIAQFDGFAYALWKDGKNDTKLAWRSCFDLRRELSLNIMLEFALAVRRTAPDRKQNKGG
jgi:hypothetical protein